MISKSNTLVDELAIPSMLSFSFYRSVSALGRELENGRCTLYLDSDFRISFPYSRLFIPLVSLSICPYLTLYS